MRKSSFFYLSLLASVAACSSGGGSSGSAGVATVQNPPAVNVAAFDGGTSTDAQVTGVSYNCADPAGCPTPATTNTAANASTVTLTNDGNGNVTAIGLNLTEGGASFAHTFNLNYDPVTGTTFPRAEAGLYEQVDNPSATEQDTLIFAGSADPTHSLSYLTYGYWASSDPTPGNTNPGAYGVFAAGTATPAANMPVTGTASYSGNVIGQLVTSTGGTDYLSGSHQEQVAFGPRTVTGSMSLDATGDNIATANPVTGQPNNGFWNTVSFSASIAPNSSHFAGTASAPSTIGNANSVVATEAMTGTIAGGFYGSVTAPTPGAMPTPAEIGGVFALSGTAGVAGPGASSAIGAFGGTHR